MHIQALIGMPSDISKAADGRSPEIVWLVHLKRDAFFFWSW